MRRNRVDVITLGCSKNLVDSEHLLRQFQAAGYRFVHNPSKVEGEVVVVNTCGFIADAQEESINTILELGEAKRKGRIGKLYVMGCLAERFMAELTAELPEVDKFYGKFSWPQLLSDLGKSYHDDLAGERVLTTPDHYAYLKISEGCNRFCAFCAIPLITGRHRSVEPRQLVSEARHLVSQGVKELNVIAQDLSSYGLDLENRMMLPELVSNLAAIPGLEWIRLHYAYPTQFPYDLLPVMAQHNQVCNYLDIALQHISDPVLTNMRRHITRDETLRLIERLRREVSGLHLRTTLMVGFPGEGEREFEELCEFVREARFERMGAFAYSEEAGTYAAQHLNDDIPAEEKQRRLSVLMQIQEDISQEIQQEKVGRTLRVMIDREDTDYYVGR
ncbi:MAG: 30S ribosomal protein S12 methylthiotransferase RimO, partial [Muribaculaceae bacterium]|nr:30S ribosomal protein S12 methylthiotransferase RimO [Muribaculaceae bacterium]